MAEPEVGEPTVGDRVVYTDEVSRRHNAVVTAIFGPQSPHSVNVVYVSPDRHETDQYGRQIKRETSVVHKSQQAAHGRFWEEA